MMVHKGGNKAGRFLEVPFLAEGGRKGVIWFSEGRFERGWRQFAGELHLLLEAQGLVAGSEEVGGSTTKILSVAPTSGIKPRRLYVQALHAISAVEDRATCSLRLLDFFPMLIRYELSFDGGGLHSTVDYVALEGLLSRSMEAAAGIARVPALGVDEEGVKRLLGLLDLKLDWVIAGLSSSLGPRFCFGQRLSLWLMRIRVIFKC
jgi:hypothetical protein